MTFCLFVWTIYVPPGHMTLKYTVIGSRAFAACACCRTVIDKAYRVRSTDKMPATNHGKNYECANPLA